MLGLFNFFKKKTSPVFDDTFIWSPFEVADKEYHVRELSLSERMHIPGLIQKQQEDGGDAISEVMVSAWLVSVACREFSGHSMSDIAQYTAPSVLSALTNKILDISGISEDATDDLEKKSKSNQN